MKLFHVDLLLARSLVRLLFVSLCLFTISVSHVSFYHLTVFQRKNKLISICHNFNDDDDDDDEWIDAKTIENIR